MIKDSGHKTQERPLKVLNLYAGIGGNRKLWDNVEVTAVELNPAIAGIYGDLYPGDTIIIGDAHQYLINHFSEFDFIWTSPPCPTHSKMQLLNHSMGASKPKYPDMKLYQEIIFLKHYFKGQWIVENVRSYYEPLIAPQLAGRHYFWANFKITGFQTDHLPVMGKTGLTQDMRMKAAGYQIDDWHGYKGRKDTLFKNCVHFDLGRHILDCAQGILERSSRKLLTLDFDIENSPASPGKQTGCQ